MPDPTVPAGNTGDADFDAALATAGAQPDQPAQPETPAQPSEPAQPVQPSPAEPLADFTFVTLENGTKEARLATGQVYRGKDDQELMSNIARAQVEASRHISTLNGKIKEIAPPEPAAPAIDPTAIAIADLLAPAFGVKNGQQLIEAFAEQRQTIQQQQEFMAAQAANAEAAQFFRAVPEFSKSQADADRIDSFLQQNNLPFNAITAEMAFRTLAARGEMTAKSAAPPASSPKNNMPAPPTGTSPASTGKGAPTEADLYAMSPDQLLELMTANTPA